MAHTITSYAALQARMADWLDRIDLTTRIPDFIGLAEIKLNQRFAREGVFEMEAMAYINTNNTGGIDDRWLPLPDSYYGIRWMRRNSDNLGDEAALTYVTVDEMNDTYALNLQGKPTKYTLTGGRIRLGPVPNAVYEIEVAYWKGATPLSDLVTTNFILEQTPNSLLFTALMEAEAYVKNDERVRFWQVKSEEAIVHFLESEKAQGFPHGLAMRAG